MSINTQTSIWGTGTLNKSKGKSNPDKCILFLNNSASFFPGEDKNKKKKKKQPEKNVLTLPNDHTVRSLKSMNLRHTFKEFISY